MPYRVRVATRVTRSGRAAGPKRTSTKYRTLRSAGQDSRMFANTYDVVKTDKRGRIIERYTLFGKDLVGTKLRRVRK